MSLFSEPRYQSLLTARIVCDRGVHNSVVEEVGVE